EIPPKLVMLSDQIEELVSEGHKAIVFTNFLSTLNYAEKIFIEKNIPVFSIQGSTSKQQREKQLKNFAECSGVAGMLMTLKTGGVGLNLTCANYVFHLEPWWNPAAENQATDRAHRMGQQNKVQVYRYLMKDSIEEKIMILKGRKDHAVAELFSEDPSDLGSV